MVNPDFYKLKPEHDGKEYPWPCEPHPDRTIQLFDDDVLTIQPDGRFVKHNGLCCVNLPIPIEHLDAYEGWPAMALGGAVYGDPKPVRKLQDGDTK